MLTTNVNGKDYLVGEHPRAYGTLRSGVVVAYHYYSTRNGERFGPIRTASSVDKPNTVGGKIVAQVSEILNADHDAMIAEATRLTEEFEASGRSGAYPTVSLITK